MRLSQDAHDVLPLPRGEEREADLIVLTVNGPEIGDFHPSVRVAAGLDRGLIHGRMALG